MDVVFADVPGDRLEPVGVDNRRFAGEEPRGVDKLACDDPVGISDFPFLLSRRLLPPSPVPRFPQRRAGVQRETDGMGAAVFAVLRVVVADAPEKSGQKSHVDGGIIRVL